MSINIIGRSSNGGIFKNHPIINHQSIHVGNLTGEGFVEALSQGVKEFKGSINADGYKGPIHLPEDLKIDGDLLLNSTAIQELPRIEVDGDLDLGSSSIKIIHEGVKVSERLFLSNCISLEKIPKNLQVGGSLILGGCIHLKADELSISDLGPLAAGYDKHTVYMNNIGLSDEVIGRLKAEVKTYPNTRIFFGSANFQKRPILIGNLTGQEFVKALKQGITEFLGNIKASGYKEKIPLIKGLTIHGNLCLSSTAIQELPKIEVDGDLDLESSSLKVIHEGVKVGGSLDLSDCKDLQKMPKYLKVGSFLDLSGCTSLKAEELSIPDLGPLAENWYKNAIVMKRIKLSDEVIERLRTEARIYKNTVLIF